MNAISIAAAIVFLSCGAGAQEPAQTALAAAQPVSVSQLNHSPWPHIGSPPLAGAPSFRADDWRREASTFAWAFESIKRSWVDEAVMSANELQVKVQQYEDLIRTIAASAGYGNALLADCLRRLSLTLTVEFALAHPAENEAVSALLKQDRVSLLDCEAVQGLLAEDLKLVPPAGGWRLSQNREELELVFRSNGSTYSREMRRVFLGLPTNAALMNRRDVYALLLRLIETETVERVHLPGLIEFRRLGGRLEDLQPNDVGPYWRVMEHDMRRFQFAPMGINMLRQEHLGEIIEDFDPLGKKLNTFTRRALE